MDERKVIAQAKKDPEAFGQIYDAYYSKIFRYIFHRTGDRELAQDLTSETFFQALKNLWRYRFQRKPFSAWLYRIALVRVALYYREKRKYLSISIEECPEILHATNPEASRIYTEGITQEDHLQEVRSVMNAVLNEKEQEVITLRYFEGLTIQEISQVMQMKENTVKSHIRRSLIKLRAYYQDQGENKKESFSESAYAEYRTVSTGKSIQK